MSPAKRLKLKRPRKERYQQPVDGIVQPPVIPPMFSPGRRTNVLDSLQSLLADIVKKRWAFHFLQPVDAKEEGMSNYHALIKRPMDLSTIARRLANRYYFQAADAIEDFRLVFKNCMLFHRKGTLAYQAGFHLKLFFNEHLAMIDLTKEKEVRGKQKRKQAGPEGPEAPKRSFPGIVFKPNCPIKSPNVEPIVEGIPLIEIIEID